MSDFHQIAGFEVVETLGYGAKSTIYHVRNRKGESYALKRVVRASQADQRFLDQAIAEHQIASQFAHPALRESIRLIKQRTFIRTTEVLVLMELVLGKTLEELTIKSHANLLSIMIDAAEGLIAMHGKNFVHADLKPNNIMLTREGQVKIIDFGQSCPIGTRKERIQGTPDYIAPEQVKRQPITIRTDVFNLGATIYWMLTGQHVPTLIPKGQGAGGLKQDKKAKVPSPRELNPAVPPALSTLVMGCVMRDPMDRPATMNEVRDRLVIARTQLERQEDQPPQREAG